MNEAYELMRLQDDGNPHHDDYEPMPTHWLNSLGDRREDVLVAMRRIRVKSDHHHTRARDLLPRGNSTAIGGEHFDHFLRGEALAVFLRSIGKGKDPRAAVEDAVVAATDMVRKWNARREWQVHRWEGAACDVIDDAMRALLIAADQA